MHMSALQWAFMFATAALQVAILVLMARRKFRSSFPFFFNFIIFSLITLGLGIVALLVPARYSQSAYAYVYWATMALGTLLTFAVVYEVFVNILKPYSALVDLGKLLFRWAFLFLALASFLTALATSGSQVTKLCATIQVLDRSSSLMQCGLLLLFLLFQGKLGLSWRSPASCIVMGLGSTAAISLVASFLRTRFPGLADPLGLVESASCVVIYAIWCASFGLPQPSRRTAQDSPTRLILQRWNEAVMASPLVARKNQPAFAQVESFLPGVEQTVERVLARKMMH